MQSREIAQCLTFEQSWATSWFTTLERTLPGKPASNSRFFGITKEGLNIIPTTDYSNACTFTANVVLKSSGFSCCVSSFAIASACSATCGS